MKTTLPTAITTVQEAKKLLFDLYMNGEVFHPDDDATQLDGDPFTDEEGKKLNALMADIAELAQHFIFDQYGYILTLHNGKDAEVHIVTDQPFKCPSCGARTDFEEYSHDKRGTTPIQIHYCHNHGDTIYFKVTE